MFVILIFLVVDQEFSYFVIVYVEKESFPAIGNIKHSLQGSLGKLRTGKELINIRAVTPDFWPM